MGAKIELLEFVGAIGRSSKLQRNTYFWTLLSNF